MRKILFYCASALCLLFVTAKPSVAGPCSPDQEVPTVYVPDRSCVDVGFGYQYQHFGVFHRDFNDNGFNVDFGMHLVDWLTGAEGRLTVGLEGTSVFGFGSTGGKPNLDAKSLFLGGGPHVAIQSRSRLEPWVHVLPGWERFRFTQTKTLGGNSGLGFMVGGGLDVRLDRGIYWRVQADYVGTVMQSDDINNNYSFGTGLILYF
jgi:hypothetical protein